MVQKLTQEKPLRPAALKTTSRTPALFPLANRVAVSRKAFARFDISRLKLSSRDLNESLLLFPGGKTLIPAPAVVKGKTLTAAVPDEAEAGFVVLLPGRGSLTNAQAGAQASNMILKDDICISTAQTKTFLTPANAVVLGYLTLACSECAINCPEHALAANPTGDCHVDPERCMGQWYMTSREVTQTTSDGRVVFTRVNETECWECFNGDELISTKCNMRRLRRVAYNSGMCCGNCNPQSQLIDLNLMELCPQGAISRLSHSHDGYTHTYFFVDTDHCTGCMSCYNNINCYNNLEYNHTLKMVAYADNDSPRFQFTVNAVKLLGDWSHVALPPIVYLLVRSDFAANSLELHIGTGNKVKITPLWNHTRMGRQVGLALVASSSVHPPLLTPEPRRFPLPVRTTLPPPFSHSGVIRLAGGKVEILYTIHE